MSHIAIIDGHNFMHRARSSFQLGDYHVVFNFFRSLRALVEKIYPSRVYFTLEGAPKRQLALLPEYKANRVIDPNSKDADKKLKSLESFRRQKGIIVDLLERHFPVNVIQHADFEADDVVFNLISRSSSAINWTVVSTDTDFLQLPQKYGNVNVYSPITKKFIDPPSDYSYVTWKALRGDASDNIPALPGIGDATAIELCNDPDKLQKLFKDPAMVEQFERNVALIEFKSWTDAEALEMRSSSPRRDWEVVRAAFTEMDFKSILKEDAWAKFTSTFDSLWST